jgi:hypothetical protein
MAGSTYTSQSLPLGFKNFTGGLNNTSGPLNVKDEESSDLLNIDFNKFGSILKRGGYTALNTSAISGDPASDGLYWFQYVSAGVFTRQPVNIAGGKMYSMNNLDGTWNDITGSVTITPDNHCDFETFLGNVYVTNGVDKPWLWNGTGNAITVAPFTANSYTFLVSGVTTIPTVGATYTNNAVTFTVVTANAGNVVATGSGAPAVSGTLIKTGGTGDANITFSAYVVNANMSTAKYVCLYNNYLFFANVTVDGVYYPTRVYWSDINNTLSWSAANWIEVAKNDGQEITGLKVLADRLVIYKTQSIYALFYTGDADIPFILPGGGKTNSHVGCISPWSIQEVDNEHIFLAFDGIYMFDGNSSKKISYRLDKVFLEDISKSMLSKSVSMVYKSKNRYLLALSSAFASDYNDTVIMWDYYNNAFSLYEGWSPSAMAMFLVGGYDERPYFGDYAGFVYRTDFGKNDYPLNTKTAIDAYYYTNWKTADDLVNQKGTLSAYIFYKLNQGTLTFAYAYDFTDSDTFSNLFQMGGSGALWGVGVWGAFSWAKSGGQIKRVDLDGRGRVVRYKFANNNMDEGFQIDGFGSYTNLETME